MNEFRTKVSQLQGKSCAFSKYNSSPECCKPDRVILNKSDTLQWRTGYRERFWYIRLIFNRLNSPFKVAVKMLIPIKIYLAFLSSSLSHSDVLVSVTPESLTFVSHPTHYSHTFVFTSTRFPYDCRQSLSSLSVPRSPARVPTPTSSQEVHRSHHPAGWSCWQCYRVR